MDSTHIVAAVLGYFTGSIPTGYLVGRAKGIDVRKVGSGNIGATNAFRILGKPAGTFVLLVDAIKGYLACTLVVDLVLMLRLSGPAVPNRETLAIIGGIAAILGHNFTCWLRFKGGKGIATSAGVLLALVPAALLIVFALWGIVFAASKYVSLASIAAAVALPFAVWQTGGSGQMLGVTTFMSVLAIIKHRANMVRLWNGTENRIGSKKTQTPPA